jgi:hypothetical protein
VQGFIGSGVYGREHLVRKSIVNRIGLAAIAGCVAVGALAFAGCGGGGSSTSTTGARGASGASGSAPLSQDEFVSQANAACKDGNDKIEALPAPPSNPDLNDLASITAQQITIANEVYGSLSAITPPSDLQSKYDAYLANGKAQIGIAQQLESAAKSGDTSQVKALAQKLAVGTDQGNTDAKALGLDECAKQVSAQG